METSWSYVDGTAYFSSDERKWYSRIRKLAEEHPDEVTIIRQPEDNDGCIYAKMPSSWFRLQPKKTRELTDEQRAELRARMVKLRSKS